LGSVFEISVSNFPYLFDHEFLLPCCAAIKIARSLVFFLLLLLLINVLAIAVQMQIFIKTLGGDWREVPPDG